MRLFAGAIGFGLALMIPCVGSATLFIPSAAFRQIYFSNSETVAFRPTIADGGTVTFGTSSPSRRLWRANPGGLAEVAVQTGQTTPSGGGGAADGAHWPAGADCPAPGRRGPAARRCPS